MKSVFVVAAFFIAGTFAEVPLSKFKKFKYEMTNPNAGDYFKVFQKIGMDTDIRNFENKKILSLDTPDAEGGKYIVKWVDVGTEGGRTEEFKNGEETKVTTGAGVGKEVTYHFAVDDEKVVITTTLGDNSMTETVVFTDNQVTETAKFGDDKATRIYEKKNVEAAATPPAAEGAAATPPAAEGAAATLPAAGGATATPPAAEGAAATPPAAEGAAAAGGAAA